MARCFDKNIGRSDRSNGLLPNIILYLSKVEAVEGQLGFPDIESEDFLRFNSKFPKYLTLPDILGFLSCVPQAQNTRFLTSNRKDSTTIDGYRLMLPHKSNPSMVEITPALYDCCVHTNHSERASLEILQI